MFPTLTRFAQSRARAVTFKMAALAILPLFILAFSLFGPFQTDAAYHHSGIVFDSRPRLLDGEPSIEPDMGVTSQALGTRATADLLGGHWPLWNHFEGLGAPLLGEMQSAALFPPTWLMALPHGQTFEQAFLQLLGGIGAFLFLRRFGLGSRAALAGGIAFEVNGVFAWLRNAIFNPVAFLPWLLFVIECLIRNAVAESNLRRRMPMIALGASVAALALYSGFPEEVYCYGLMLVAWTAVRMSGLDRRQNLRFATDLLLTGLIALLLSAPLLVAFLAYLGEAELGGHAGNGFAGVWLSPETVIQYISPYIYGRVFGSSNPMVTDIWSGTGGYVGFVPVVFAFGSLLVPGRGVVKLFLVAWITVALGVTQGVPGLYQAFIMIPLAKTAAVYRYLDASWIFAFVMLSALFIDAVPALPARLLRRTVLIAVGCALLVAMLATRAAWPLLSDLLATSARDHRTIIRALFCVVALSALACGVTLGRRSELAATLLAGIMIIEAVGWFGYPYLSSPRGGKLDRDLVAFLRDNAGYQRVVDTLDAGLSPNYGSYFGISLLNYDDLPSPKLTVAYVRQNLDPYASTIALVPQAEGLTPEQQADEQRLFRARLAAYGQAGVKFALAASDLDLVSPFQLGAGQTEPYVLATGQQIEIVGHAEARISVSAISVLLEAGQQTLSGHLNATICVGTACADGGAEVGSVLDDRLAIPLDRPIATDPAVPYSLRLTNSGSVGDVALPTFALSSEAAATVRGSHAPIPAGVAPDIRLKTDDVRLAYASRSMRIYQLSSVRPYFSAQDCVFKASSRDAVEASCARPSKLTRLEQAMQGWSAAINGAPAGIGMADGVFQTVDLPAGESRVTFSYEPRLFRPSLAAACLGMLAIAIGIALAIKDRVDPVS